MPLPGNVLLEKEICRIIYWFYLADRIYIGGTKAFYFDNTSAEDVSFVSLDSNSELVSLEANNKYISEAVDVFCQAGIDQQAQQSTHLAGGLSPL